MGQDFLDIQYITNCTFHTTCNHPDELPIKFNITILFCLVFLVHVSRVKVCLICIKPMVLILNGNSEHVATA